MSLSKSTELVIGVIQLSRVYTPRMLQDVHHPMAQLHHHYASVTTPLDPSTYQGVRSVVILLCHAYFAADTIFLQ